MPGEWQNRPLLDRCRNGTLTENVELHVQHEREGAEGIEGHHQAGQRGDFHLPLYVMRHKRQNESAVVSYCRNQELAVGERKRKGGWDSRPFFPRAGVTCFETKEMPADQETDVSRNKTPSGFGAMDVRCGVGVFSGCFRWTAVLHFLPTVVTPYEFFSVLPTTYNSCR